MREYRVLREGKGEREVIKIIIIMLDRKCLYEK